MIDNPGFREGFAAIIDKSSNINIWKRGKEVSVDYECNGYKFSAHSGGYINNLSTGYAYFEIGVIRHKLYGSRGLNFCLYSIPCKRIIDLFSVDTYADKTLKIQRFTFIDNLLGSSSDECYLIAFEMCSRLTRRRINIEALIRLSYMYRNGKGVEKNLDQSLEYLKKITEDSNRVKRELVKTLLKRNIESEKKELLELVKTLSDNGDVGATVRLGIAYRDGNGVKKDINKALDYFKGVADKSDWAKNRLLSLLIEIGSKDSLNEALQYALQFSATGNKIAFRHLAEMYYYGHGVEKDLDTSLYYMENAINISSDSGKKEFIEMLLSSPHKKHWNKAFRYCKEWLYEGDQLRILLIRMYWNGVGTLKNRISALSLANQTYAYRNSFSLEPIHVFNDEIFRYEDIIVWNSKDDGNSILCSCIQNNLFVKYSINDSDVDGYMIPPYIDEISLEDAISLDNPAIIISHRDYTRLITKKMLTNNIRFFIYSENTLIKRNNTFNLLKINPNLRRIVVVSDDDSSEIVAYLGEMNVGIEAVITSSNIYKILDN